MTAVIRLAAGKAEIHVEREKGSRREDPMSTTDTFRHLRDDHARVLSELDVLAELAHAPTPGAREIDELRGVVVLLERECVAHMRAEEEALFPALAEVMPEAAKSFEPLRAEHAELKDMLTTLAGVLAGPAGSARDEQIAVQSSDLVDLFRIHVRKEEALIFRMAERVLPEESLRHLADRLLVHAPPPNRKGFPSGDGSLLWCSFAPSRAAKGRGEAHPPRAAAVPPRPPSRSTTRVRAPAKSPSTKRSRSRARDCSRPRAARRATASASASR